MEEVFPASGNGFSIECHSFRRVGTDFFSSVVLFRANVDAIANLYSNKGKTISYRVTSLLLLETIFCAFFIYIYIFLPVKAVFRRSENVFFNESFILAGGIRIFV